MNKKITRTLGSYGEVNPEFMQYEFAFRKACDIVIKYDFESEICTIHRFSMDLIFIEEAAGDYDRLFNEFIQKYIVEEDRLAVKKVLALENVVSSYKDGEEEQVTQFRVRDGFGNIYWLLASTYFYDEDGRRQMYTIHRNVTKSKEIDLLEERKRIEEEKRRYEDNLSDDEHKYKIVVEHSDAFIFEWRQGVGFNFRTEPDRYIFAGMFEGRSVIKTLLFGDIVHKDDAAAFRRFCSDMNSGNEKGSIVVRLRNVFGQYMRYRINLTDTYSNGIRTKRVGSMINLDVNEI